MRRKRTLPSCADNALDRAGRETPPRIEGSLASLLSTGHVLQSDRPDTYTARDFACVIRHP